MNMLKKILLTSLTALTLINTAQAAGLAQVTGVDGRVVAERAGKQFLVQSGTVLQEGDQLITLGNSGVKVQFGQCPKQYPNNSRTYGSSERLVISAANQCGNARKVRLRTETVRDGSGFNSRPIQVGNVPTPNVPVATGFGAGRALGIGLGVLAAGAIINEINKDEDCVSGC